MDNGFWTCKCRYFAAHSSLFFFNDFLLWRKGRSDSIYCFNHTVLNLCFRFYNRITSKYNTNGCYYFDRSSFIDWITFLLFRFWLSKPIVPRCLLQKYQMKMNNVDKRIAILEVIWYSNLQRFGTDLFAFGARLRMWPYMSCEISHYIHMAQNRMCASTLQHPWFFEHQST